jgi:hypothetical protein
MIDLHAVGHVTDTASLILELVSENRNSVASFHEALTELVDVRLDTAELRESKVGDDKDVVLLL